MPESSSLTFLPHLLAGINAMPAAGTLNGHRTVEVQVEVLDDSGADAAPPVTRRVSLKGPGEIVAFSQALIARTEPKAGENAFESNYFPFVEFTDPDFPWRYSVEPGTDVKLKPWLSLIVLKSSEYQAGASTGGKLPSISVSTQWLPDLAQSWAWAHVQIGQGMDLTKGRSAFNADVVAIERDRPEITCSRVMCSRRLRPQTAYSAFVVPVYRMGVDAALGREVVCADTLAWESAVRPFYDVELPVYHRWDFQTAQEGDLEELLSRLACRDAAETFKGKRVEASRPGYFMKNGTERHFLGGRGPLRSPDSILLDGALVPPGFMAKGRAPLAAGDFTTQITGTLNDTLCSGLLDDAGGEDPLVSLPVYGRDFRQTKVIRLPSPRFRDPSWVSEVNLDRRLRVAASQGTAVVKEKQEEYVRRCFEQVGEIREANSLVRYSAAARHAGESVKARHFEPLGDFRFVLATRPCHHYYARPGSAVNLKGEVAASGLPRGLLSQTFKRVVAGRIGIRSLDNHSVYGDWLTGGDEETLTPDTDHDFMMDLARLSDPEGAEKYRSNPGPSVPPLKPRIIPLKPVPIGEALRELIDVEEDLLDRLNSLISLPSGRKLRRLDTLLAGPVIDDPMYRRLAQGSLDSLAPGLGGIPPNSVLCMEENRKFIEAHMVGLCHEMNRELKWRGYPSLPDHTVFRHFWESFGAVPQPDIAPIARWNRALGGNRGSKAFNDVVLVIKGDVVRRYPDTIIFALNTTVDLAQWNWDAILALLDKGASDATYRPFRPVFSARPGTDTLFLGFPFSVSEAQRSSFYFVLMQHPTLPRFGLNLSREGGAYEGWDALSWPDVPLDPSAPDGSFDPEQEPAFVGTRPLVKAPALVANRWPEPAWVHDSAALAQITFQDPVRMVVPARIFLPPERPVRHPGGFN